jgi:hypothetical protein
VTSPRTPAPPPLELRLRQLRDREPRGGDPDLPLGRPGDPADHSEAERLALGIVPLPASLTEALAALEADAIARSWMPLLNDTTY